MGGNVAGYGDVRRLLRPLAGATAFLRRLNKRGVQSAGGRARRVVDWLTESSFPLWFGEPRIGERLLLTRQGGKRWQAHGKRQTIRRFASGSKPAAATPRKSRALARS